MEEIPVAWTKLEQAGATPSKRSGHTLTMCDGKGYLFGGIDLKHPPGPNSDLYSFEIEENAVTWKKENTQKGPVPPARWRHTATHVPGKGLLVFGGFSSATCRLNDSWIYSNGQWSHAVKFVPPTPTDADKFARKRRGSQSELRGHRAHILRARNEEITEDRKPPTEPFNPHNYAPGSMAPGSGSVFLEDFGVNLEDPEQADHNPCAPSPRGAHTAVLIDDYVYIFGGYGGAGYARKDYNDLYRLHTSSMEWVKTDSSSIQGTPPTPRSGHAAVACGQKMFVFGGWSGMQTFNDLWVLDTAASTWTHLEQGTYGVPRWNTAAISVNAVPHWQVFFFGGSSGGADSEEAPKRSDAFGYLGDTVLMSLEDQVWKDITPAEGGPMPRADAAIVYEPQQKRLLVFGGWANRWYGDMHALSVASIIGPPYAILSVEPNIGPITGNQPVVIKAMGLEPGKSVTVRFSLGRRFAETTATAESADTVTVMSPKFDQFVPGKVDVRISVADGPFSITTQKYTYFLVTEAKHCFAFGPGLSSGGVAETPISFLIHARDSAKQNRFTGGDEFEVLITPKDEVVPEGQEPTRIPATVQDDGSGRYLVSYTPPAPGKYTVRIGFKGTYEGTPGEIRGSPFEAEVFAANGHPLSSDPKELAAYNTFSSPLLLSRLQQLIAEAGETAHSTLAGVTAEVPQDSLDALLRVKNYLAAVVGRDAEVTLQIDEADGIIASLRRSSGGSVRKEREIAALDSQLNKARVAWETSKKEAPKCRARIAPFVKQAAGTTRKDIEAFEAATEEYAQRVYKKCSFWLWDTGYEGAMADIEAATTAHNAWLKKVKRVQYLADTFEFSNLLDETHRICRELVNDCDEMSRIWKIAKETEVYFESTKDLLWSQVKPMELEDTAKSIQKKLRTGGSRVTRQSGAYKGLDKQIRDFLSTCPLIAALSHKSMRPRHWKLLMEATKKDFVPPHEDPDMKLRNLLELNMHEHSADVDEICDQALKEEKMEETLQRLVETWGGIRWITESYKGDASVPLLKLSDEDFETLEADQLAVQSMMASRYLATFETEVTGWQKSLGNISDVFTQLTDIQHKWAYLEPLFMASDEVRTELPNDAARFEGIDQGVKTNLREMAAAGIVEKACNKEGLLQELMKLQEGLDLCEKALTDFLAGKQREFPRFYFVSKSDLLDILSNGSNPRRILHHITKVFLQTDTLMLDDVEVDNADPSKRPSALVWKSAVGVEEVAFDPPVLLAGKPEHYLQTVLTAQHSTLKKTLQASIARLPSQSRIEWLMNKDQDGKPTDPAQISLLVSGMEYVNAMETSLDNVAAGDAEAMQRNLDHAVSDLADLVRLTQTDLSRADRTRVMCMITLDAHGRDIIQKMIVEKVQSKSAFQWQSQLKQKWDGTEARLSIADARFNYGYEYLGNGPRLVVTPLTDRIYVTATQALNLKMGCAPAGPAGTGKTETTKDLANALAITCYVFNCSPEMDYLSLGNIFKGLAASGSWGCFDEFNRLVPEVLSVCSVQFKAVCDGIRSQSTTVVIEGDRVALQWTAGAFITMNPGYLGRSELPEGLKSLFRPITVMVPDLVLICENMLMAEGFIEAKLLASKFFSLYSLLKELLSKQSHYDWGLRAIKSVLVVAGTFKRAEPDLPEQALLCRALRDFNTPKIVKQDEVIFFGLLSDLFPGVDPPRKLDPQLEDAVEQACVKKGLTPDPLFRLKVVQLEELLAIRHCVFVMGPPGSGKSQCWQTLKQARAIMKNKTKTVDLDPKVVTPEELYGYIHPQTREPKDGLLSSIMRSLGAEPNEDPKWIVLDGDLDANWIESMNSVMDDNKMLTLASNERIPLKKNMRMVFEIRDLNHATPATVSRAGIIYISTSTGSQWRSIITSWLLQLKVSEKVKDVLRVLFDRYCAPTLLYLRKECEPLVPVEEVTLITNLIRLLKCLLTPARLTALEDEEKPPEEVQSTLETFFVFATIWSMGSMLSLKDGEDYRARFSEYWKSEYKTIRIPSRDTVFDYWLNPDNLSFEPWKDSPLFKTVKFDSQTMSMTSITVPTPETCSVTYWMELLVAARDPVMLVGYAGCGKTQLVQGLLNALNPEEKISFTINFNYYTDSRALQTIMETPLEKKAGNNYAPPGQLALVYYLDDFNLPEVDPYDTQSAIALVRQHFDYGHWYERNRFTLRNIGNCQYIASMNPAAGSFVVNPRMQRHFFTLAIAFPGPASLHTIYSTFMEGHLSRFDAETAGSIQALLGAALQLHAAVATTFRKSATNFHYEFNIRHLSNVFQGLLQAQPAEFQSVDKFALLWLHESERVYGDRLVSNEDFAKYKQLAQAVARRRFPNVNMGNFFGENADPLVFCHFAGAGDRVYDRATTMDALKQTLEESLREYNENFATMNLVLFNDAINHVCRISRIILSPAGHALLVGVGGSGKQSLTRLAAYMCNYTVRTITISNTYGLNDLKEDLKSMYDMAGLREEGVLFLLTDSQITNERFLVLINDLLASGNIPDLFATDEVDSRVNAVVSKVRAAGLAPERKVCWDYYLEQVRKNLHVVLCFSPVGEDFRTRARRFPALVNCTVIDWFQPWPVSALYSVGARFLSKMKGLGDDPAVREGIEKFLPFSFAEVNNAAQAYAKSDRRHVYTTPKSFLELLQLYADLLAAKNQEIDRAIQRLSDGLTKLRTTGEEVARIEEDLKVQLAEAEEARARATAIAHEVSANKLVVEEESAKANVIAAEAAEAVSIATQIAADAQRDLDAALPMVEEAKKSLAGVTKRDLDNCRTMATPPGNVPMVFDAVTVLLGSIHKSVNGGKSWSGSKVPDKELGWAAAKRNIMGDTAGLLEMLMSFGLLIDEGKVPALNFQFVEPYISDEGFTPEKIKNSNSAAAGLCNWVINITKYYKIVSEVEPKRQKAEEARITAESASQRKLEAEERVRELTAALEELQIKFQHAEKEKNDADNAVARGKMKSELANRLTNALADENVRWAASVATMEEQKPLVVGDTLLSAAFISYIGPFTKVYRDRLLKKWTDFLLTAANGESIPMSQNPNPLNVLTNEANMAVWKSEGLPDDRVSIENGVIVTSSARWPLLIDPQLQGISWLREHCKSKDLLIVRLDQKNLLQQLKISIERGSSVLIENMGERIPASLAPLIARQFVKKGHRSVLQLAGEEVDFHRNFRLYLHTKLSNPHYPPEVQAETCLVNFTVTEAGLEDQLLALTVSKERPDLSSLKTALISQQNAFKIQMNQLEDGILARLTSAEGDVTEDRELIESLENTKRIAADIAEKQAIAKSTEAEINVTSEKYRPVAQRASLLFFLMYDLFKIHTYYIYSLNAFVNIFSRAIDLVSGPNDPMRRPEDEEDDDVTEASTTGASVLGDAAPPAALPEPAAPNTEAASPESGEVAATGEGTEATTAAESVAAEAAPADAVEVDTKEEPTSPMADAVGLASPKTPPARILSDEELAERCKILMDSTTKTTFAYLARGLFERDKLTVATQLTLRILEDQKILSPQLIQALVMGLPLPSDPGPMAALADWMSESTWQKVKALEAIKPVFEHLGMNMQDDSDRWCSWVDDEKPETLPLPGEYKTTVEPIHLLLLLRALRPDRLVTALRGFIAEMMGPEFVNPPPFSMAETYKESNRATPIFFVLFPGVDPTVWVEGLGRTLGFTTENKKFINISMGQGQEAPAMRSLESLAESGGWLMLQNVHLMQSWLPQLERALELAGESAHPDFRCFISAEPPPLSYLHNMPESLMQSCIKVANEAPSDLLSNLTRSWKLFSPEFFEASKKPTEFKACLFTLTWYHAIVLGRRRFGQQGWSRQYSFNTGDLTVCANVLSDYINQAADNNNPVPWEDLRYIFGEIMYGGHITDAWDRRTNNTYLSVFLKPAILEGHLLGPDFPVPSCATMSPDQIGEYMEKALPRETPPMFGLHSNAEIGYLTSFADTIFNTILTFKGGDTSSGQGDGGPNVRAVLNDLLERLPPQFSMIDLELRAEPLLNGPSAPYVIVALQECTRMNALLTEIERSLVELGKGLDGSLNMSEPMEDLAYCLSVNMVPGRNPFHKCSWEKIAWPSKKMLPSWFADMRKRVQHLETWASTLETPLSVWLPGIFNPMAILTAAMQVTARNTSQPLDQMAIDTHITTFMSPDEVTEPPENGLYVHGLFMEGSRWTSKEEITEIVTIGNTPCGGHIVESKLKELLPTLPVIYLRAVPVQSHWIPSSVGYLRQDPSIYEAPVYITTFRGPTFVFLATLESKDPTWKWTLAGCALVLQEDN